MAGIAADMIGDQLKNNLIPKKEGESESVMGLKNNDSIKPF